MLSVHRANLGVLARRYCRAHRWGHLGCQQLDPFCGLRKGLATNVDLANVAQIAKQLVLLEQPLGHLGRAADDERTLWASHLLNRRASNVSYQSQLSYQSAGRIRARLGVLPKHDPRARNLVC